MKAVIGAACAATALSLLVPVVPAQAKIKHIFERGFCAEGSNPGQCQRAYGVAVNYATHDVYVTDETGNRVEQFSANGEGFIREFTAPVEHPLATPTQVAVDNSGNAGDPSDKDVYVAGYEGGHNVIDKFSSSGVFLGQLTGTTCDVPLENREIVTCPKNGTIRPFTNVVGLTVDKAGTVWVIEKEGSLDSFSDGLSNEPLTIRVTDFGRFGIEPGLAVDALEDFYVNPGGGFAKVDMTGLPIFNPYCRNGREEATGAALDSSLDVVYVDEITSIAECDTNNVSVERFGSGHLAASEGVAADGTVGAASSGAVYASRKEASGEVALFAAVEVPTVIATEPSEQTPTSIKLNGTVNPGGHEVTSCVFEYDTQPFLEAEVEEEEQQKGKPVSEHGTRVPCSPSAAELKSGSVPVPVSVRISSLAPDTQYYYRVRATNAAGAGSSCERSGSPCQSYFTGPILSGEWVSGVGSNSATLRDTVSPNGDDTHYYFEYGTQTSYGSFAPAVPPGEDIGAGRVPLELAIHVQNLQPGAIYHYRLVAEQSGELFYEQDHIFTTQSGMGGEFTLPDGRAWELVSPNEKKGALIEFFPGFSVTLQAADNGGGIIYRASGQLGENPAGKGPLSYVLSSRSGLGWRSRDLTLPDQLPPEEYEPSKLNGGAEYVKFSPDLSLAAVEPHRFTPPLSPLVSERTLYLLNTNEERFSPLVTPANTPTGTLLATETPEPMRVYAASPNLAHLVIRSPVALSEPGYSEYYEWSDGELLPIGVLPDGKRYEGLMSLAGSSGEFGSAQRIISDDGRWVAWTAGDPYVTADVPLYVRDMITETTVQVGGPNSRYQTMNSDGSRIFYIEDGNLFEFDTTNDISTNLTPTHGAKETNAGVKEAVSDVSTDGSYVYFVATGILQEGSEQSQPVSGQPNLYVLHDTGAETSVTYITTLSPEDEKSWHGYSFTEKSAPALALVTSRVSPDGRYLAFMSERALTGYDNIDAVSGQRDEEVYLYDAVTDQLVCASCNPTGARPVGILDKDQSEPLVDRSGVWSGRHLDNREHWLAGSLPGWDEGNHGRSMYQPRYLSNNGRLFFDSPDSLVPQATNGVEDVYEYEPPGTGDCSVAGDSFSRQSNGCINLVSSGIASNESAFFDASENGDDVFFITTAKLVRQDFDAAYDVYDAHVCSASLPCPSEVVGLQPCESSDSCKGASSPQPEIFGPPPSATFLGNGNVVVASGGTSSTKPLTKAQQLSRALKVCRRKPHSRRAACEREARRHYGKRSLRGGRGDRRANQ